MITRKNNKIEIISFKFSGIINGYYIKLNEKEFKEKGKIKTFKTEQEAIKFVNMRGDIF